MDWETWNYHLVAGVDGVCTGGIVHLFLYEERVCVLRQG